MINIFLSVLLFLLIPAGSLTAGEVYLDEEFTSLDRWEPFHFSNIENHSSYSLVSFEGRSALKGVANNSASAMLLKRWFNVYEYPLLAWRFQVSNIYKKGDARKKDGDDYPVRLYVMFKYDPAKASFAEKIQYELAKALDGKYPPHSSLNYIWANREQAADIIISPYSSRSLMIPMVKGGKLVGTWVEHRTNIVEDYKKAFGESPPVMAKIAVMSDADNTGESATAYIDYIRIMHE